MDWAMSRPAFKTQLFRFVDVFPALDGREDIARHLAEYFDGVDVPKALDLGVDLADRVPFGAAIEAAGGPQEHRPDGRAVHRRARRPRRRWPGCTRCGGRAAPPPSTCSARRPWCAEEADRYQARVLELLDALCAAAPSWAPDDRLERDDLGPLPRVNVSIKPTALATHYEPLSRTRGHRVGQGAHPADPAAGARARRPRPLRHGALRRQGPHALAVPRAAVRGRVRRRGRRHRRSRPTCATRATTWPTSSRGRAAGRTPITVRLVKGAYWDAETVHARASGWTPPVFEHKDETDASYERCVRLLHDHHGEVRAAFGSHNLRSLAYAVSYGRHRGVPDHGYEVQLLYGMAEPVHAAIKRLGPAAARLRAGGRARARHGLPRAPPAREHLQRELRPPPLRRGPRPRRARGAARTWTTSPGPPRRPSCAPTDADAIRTPYEPEPLREWRRGAARAAFSVAVDRVRDGLGLRGAGRHRRGAGAHRRHHHLRRPGADRASSWPPRRRARPPTPTPRWRPRWPPRPAWRRAPAVERAGLLFRAADWMRQRRDELAALQCFEAAKPWDQADGDVVRGHRLLRVLRPRGPAPGRRLRRRSCSRRPARRTA